MPGEFGSIPSRVDAAEDEGVLMGFVFDAATQRSDPTLLDAGTLDPVAAVHLPDRVPRLPRQLGADRLARRAYVSTR